MQSGIYSPEHQSTALESNRLEIMAEMHPRRWWRTDITKRMIGGAHRGWAASRWDRLNPHVSGSSPASVKSLLELLGGFLIKSYWKHRFTKTCEICQFKPLS